MESEKKTPLYSIHEAAHGKMVPFAGYLLPVQYSGVIAEHMAVRTAAGLFDVSHMGEIMFSGPDALQNINHLFTNDFTNMTDGRVRYSPMCNDEGGVLDDLIVYRFDNRHYFVVVNAANREKDVAWMRAHLSGEVTMTDLSEDVAQIALQGPHSTKILSRLTSEIPQKYYTFLRDAEIAGIRCLASQTGYTGETGYELYCAAPDASALWNAVMNAGSEDGLIPCGLGARDTLRLEAAMPLYGHEMDEHTTPLEAGLGFSVKMQKADFIGKKALEERAAPQKTRIGLKITGRGIAREKCPVYIEEEHIGTTTSGTHCPYLGGAYAMAFVHPAHAAVGTVCSVDVRGKRVGAVVTALPFYKKS